ncbi:MULTISPECIES: DUF11 domain-containing protein [unclassified Brevundimonas]|uniref:DUF11 domain-containing protein n=1 Tax=unclassified Brevundimonas TaxID=2622653 RepID=UPI003F8E7902
MKRYIGLVCGALLSAAATTAAAQSADLSITKTDGQTTATAGTNVAYTITASNAGPDMAASAMVTDILPGWLTFVSLAAPGGWTCTTPPVGVSGAVTCSTAGFASGASATFSLTTQLSPAAVGAFSNTATITSATADPTPGNNSAADVDTAVAAPPAPVPTLTEWAMILFGLVLAGGAALHLQRRRAAA